MTVPESWSTPTNPWVESFAEGWQAPTDPDSFVEHFREWLQEDCRFVQPLVMGRVTGLKEFRERFVGPTFDLISDMHGSVENWAARNNTVYLELRVTGYVGHRPLTLRSCERITLRDDRWSERVTYVDSLPLLFAVLRTPRIWPRAIRLQIDNIRTGWRTRQRSDRPRARGTSVAS
jgi:hypothetical protein